MTRRVGRSPDGDAGIRGGDVSDEGVAADAIGVPLMGPEKIGGVAYWPVREGETPTHLALPLGGESLAEARERICSRRVPDVTGETLAYDGLEWHRALHEPTHVAYEVAVADERDRVIEAARAYRDFVKPRQHVLTPESLAEWHAVKDEFYDALDCLDAARGAS